MAINPIPDPTIDDFADTTVMRFGRKLVKYIQGLTGKTNEIITAVNNTDLESISELESKVTKNTNDISQIQISVTENEQEIKKDQTNISANAVKLKAVSDTVDQHTTEIDALTKELPTEISAISNSVGKVYIETELEDGTILNSSTADLKVPATYQIISGTTNRSFKLRITLSDNTTFETNDFVIPEGGGTSVTVTSVNLTKTNDTLQVAIGLDDGTSIKSETVNPINTVTLVTDANILRATVNGVRSSNINLVKTVALSYADSKLKCTVNGVESSEVTIDASGNVYTAGNGINISDSNVVSVDSSVVALKSDITQLQTAVQDCFNEVSVNGSNLEFTALDGQVNSVEIPTDKWIDISLPEFVARGGWKIGDKILCQAYPTNTNYNNVEFIGIVTNIPYEYNSECTGYAVGFVNHSHNSEHEMEFYPTIYFAITNTHQLKVYYYSNIPESASIGGTDIAPPKSSVVVGTVTTLKISV